MASNLTFHGGVHPLPKIHHGKGQTQSCPIEVMTPPAVVSIPCAQHIGRSAKPLVSAGDHVKKGQRIAEADGFISVPVHASVSGTVKEVVIKPNKIAKPVVNIVIENDFQEELSEEVVPKGEIESLSPEEIKKIVFEAGNVGLGGAGFPTHVKLAIPEGTKMDAVIVNGCECEPFLTADHRLMLEQPERVVFGLRALMRAIGVEVGYIAVEENKPDAAAALEKVISSPNIKVKMLQTKYPQGSEKQLVDALLGRQIPPGKLPLDVGVVVVNAASAAAICDAIRTGMPLIERIVTVTGCFQTPKNVLARLGTPLEEIIAFCGGFSEEVDRLIAGGPMMGVTLDHVNGVVTKTTSGLLALGKDLVDNRPATACIRCGKCMEACPIHLLPMYISAASDMYDFEKAERYHAMDCIGCGCCSYICPAKRNIAQSIRVAKDEIAAARRKKQQGGK